MRCVLALWAAVIAGAVFGRIIEKEPEILNRDPSLNLEQANDYNREFYRTSSLVGLSQLEQLNENPYFFAGSVKTNSRSDRRVSNVASGFSNQPTSHVTNETAKEYVKKYISDSFQYTSGLHTTIQRFEPLQFMNIYDNSQVPLGANIIGVIQGKEWGTPNDKPLVVGAHWDTVNFTPGTDDNGSGVAAMLETARAIAHSACKPKYTIIFVAFDLEEVGSQGSLIFIKEYLMKVLKLNFPKEVGMAAFQGAFIMDTIMDFNDTEYSQTFPTDWSLVVPDVYDEVANEKYKGDFLSMIYRRDVDNRLAEKFHFHWGKSNHDQKFKLKPIPLMLTADLPELEILADHLNFLRSDHARFWYMNDSAVPHTLNAVLMTDTGPYRGNMRNCYHTVCDGPEVSLNANPDNIKFLEKITQALTDTIVDMSECDLGESNNTREPYSSNVYLSTGSVNVKNSSPRGIGSPLKYLMNFVKWMQPKNP
ncbi:unnamed protein product [Allacma fusca]|uniref:Peptidase M28 domain-containing protein n=1 Tax=Allacma fusca TaxID=39272 RepID=A0A8J2P7R8_9HEXA|nr:unnamed protein product [Allacma fusca]